jgi:CheY-like chemotaxis protein
VFSNLLTNASKFSAPGGEIRIGASRCGAKVMAEVVDQGIGIAPSMLPRVFDLFEQEASTLDRAHGGLGLGLSIVRNLVSQHGGHVRAESEGLGRGSRFIVKLPVAAASPPVPESASNTPAAPRARGLRVLVVDDNVDAAATLSLALETSGYTVAVAEDGRSALERAVEFQPEVAVLDIGLPGMDGYELARALRGAFPGRALGLVALTGYGQPDDLKQAREAGFDAHLLKPVDIRRLCALVDSLARRDQRADVRGD